MLHLIAVVALLQQESAQETFDRIEKSVEQAKTVRIKCRLDLAQGAQTAVATATLLLKEGNKAKITMDGAKGNPWSVSDGSKVTVDARQAVIDGASWDTPKDLNARLSTAFVRWGLLDLPELPRRIHAVGRNPKERLKMSDFKFGEQDGGLQSLTYVLKENNGKADVTLWYDPKSLALKKRILSVDVNPRANVTETYDEFTVNGEIPDESFKP